MSFPCQLPKRDIGTLEVVAKVQIRARAHVGARARKKEMIFVSEIT